jgi:hypothetical protein
VVGGCDEVSHAHDIEVSQPAANATGASEGKRRSKGGKEDGEGAPGGVACLTKPGAAVVHAMRAGLLLLASAAQAEVLSVYICAEHLWQRLLRPLAPVPTVEPLRIWPCVATETDPRLVKLNEEAYVASYDPSVVPNMLLFVQAGLPFAPRHPRQHSLQALARAFVKLSSGANQRQELPLMLERVAAFRGRDVLDHDVCSPDRASADLEERRDAGDEGHESFEIRRGGCDSELAESVTLYTSATQVVSQTLNPKP